MSCPSQLRRRPGAPASTGNAPEGPRRRTGGTAQLVVERIRRDDVWGQFLRFLLVGGSSTAVYAVLFLSLRSLGYLPAHIVATVVSTVLANEMHRRLTFHADERVGWLAAQLEAGGVSVFGLVATSVALGWLDAHVSTAPAVLQISLVAAVTGLIGLIRFVALRWIFRPTGALSPQ